MTLDQQISKIVGDFDTADICRALARRERDLDNGTFGTRAAVAETLELTAAKIESFEDLIPRR